MVRPSEVSRGALCHGCGTEPKYLGSKVCPSEKSILSHEHRAIPEPRECIFVDPAHFDVLLTTTAHDGLMRFGRFFRYGQPQLPITTPDRRSTALLSVLRWGLFTVISLGKRDASSVIICPSAPQARSRVVPFLPLEHVHQRIRLKRHYPLPPQLQRARHVCLEERKLR